MFGIQLKVSRKLTRNEMHPTLTLSLIERPVPPNRKVKQDEATPSKRRLCKRILLVYGGGSIKRSGLYDDVITILNDLGAQVHELAGVEPNPRLSTVHQGVELCRQEQIDLILTVFGGSVIECVKAIAVGARFKGDVWDVITKRATATGALPFGTILTLAANGTELNRGSVIANWATKEKVGWNAAPYSYPTFSICDPVYTFTVPRDQTVYGIVDSMSYALETYFPGATNTPVQDRWIEGLLRTVIELSAFRSGIGAPSWLADYGIGAEQIAVMAAKATPNGVIGRTRQLGPADVADIYRLSL